MNKNRQGKGLKAIAKARWEAEQKAIKAEAARKNREFAATLAVSK